jgi:8-oxo-dGTP pyrophosphatase MutT (NUDIX family)
MKVGGCFVNCKGELLFLQRAVDKPQPFKLGIPSGKVKRGEPLSYATGRELKEETGIQYSVMSYLGVACVRFPEYDFEYHMFAVQLSEKPHVVINPAEHQDYVWQTPDEAKKLDLIEDMWECIEQYYMPHHERLSA